MKPNRAVLILVVVSALSVWAATASAAYEFYVTIEGVKQGKFKGDGKAKAHPGTIACLAFAYEVKSPRDASTGMATGRRQHEPIVITKRWDSASPQLFQALVSNESLKSVLLEFVRTRPDGQEEVYYTITLQDAMVVGIKQYTDAAGGRELEDVSFSFQRIFVEDKVGKAASMDAWRK